MVSAVLRSMWIAIQSGMTEGADPLFARYLVDNRLITALCCGERLTRCGSNSHFDRHSRINQRQAFAVLETPPDRLQKLCGPN